jgi:uncharacterized protein YdhG (YjbR/CyaY superfamily)
MKEHAAELRAAKRRAGAADKAEQEAAAVVEKIAEMPDADRVLAERIHALVATEAPVLAAKLWYGMPAWARDGKIVCFFQAAEKFKARYATLGFNDAATLDAGALWPTSFALVEWTDEVEATVAVLLRRSVG